MSITTNNSYLNFLYPFGMVMPGRTFTSSGGEYRFGFNGMEKDGEGYNGEASNQYTTEFRQYDPRLGKWTSLDPLMSMFPHTSPYAAFANNPIYYKDPTGLAPATGDGDKSDNNSNDGYKFNPDDVNLEDVTVVGHKEITIVIEKIVKPLTIWQKMANWSKKTENKLKGNTYWKIGIIFNTTDGAHVDGGAPKLDVSDPNSLFFTIENWDEVEEIVTLVQLGLDANSNGLPFSGSSMKLKTPVGIKDFNKLRQLRAGKGNNSPKQASVVFQTLKQSVKNYNKNPFVKSDQFAGSIILGGDPGSINLPDAPILDNSTSDDVLKKAASYNPTAKFTSVYVNGVQYYKDSLENGQVNYYKGALDNLTPISNPGIKF